MGTPVKSAGHARGRAFRIAALSLAGALGLLLWARLKLMTDTPRMVYADPPAGSREAPGAPAGPGGAAPPVE